MKISPYLQAEYIRVHHGAKDKPSALREAAELLRHDTRVTDFEGFYADVLQRERLMSTGMGYGLAFPEGVSKHVTRLIIAVGIYPDGIPFDSLDNKPVRLLVLVGIPRGSDRSHLPPLNSLIRLVLKDDVREALIRCVSAEQFIDTLRQAETVH